MATYMLVIRDTDESKATLASHTPEQMQRMMGEMLGQFMAWSDRLRSAGRYVDGQQLMDGGAVVRPRGGQIVVDGPYTETKESIGGYFVVKAESLDEATDAAKDCPALAHGYIVEVRELLA